MSSSHARTGRLSFAYFSVAADRKVSRHQGETTSEKNTLPQTKNIKKLKKSEPFNYPE